MKYKRYIKHTYIKQRYFSFENEKHHMKEECIKRLMSCQTTKYLSTGTDFSNN